MGQVKRTYVSCGSHSIHRYHMEFQNKHFISSSLHSVIFVSYLFFHSLGTIATCPVLDVLCIGYGPALLCK